MKDPARRARAAPASLAALREKYGALWRKHRRLVRDAARSAQDRIGVVALGRFALRATSTALALADGATVLFRNDSWHALDRDRTRWRAIARDPALPAEAPTLGHLATRTAKALLARGAPQSASGRYERPELGSFFDVRAERILGAGQPAVGISVRDVTRLVSAERQLSVARADAAAPGEAGVARPARRHPLRRAADASAASRTDDDDGG